MAVALTSLGALSEAERQWRLVVAEVPQYRPGWQGLGETLVRQNKLSEAAQLGKKLQSQPRFCSLGLFLKSQVALVQGNSKKARQLLEDAVRQCPDEQEPLRELSRFHFERGDPAAAQSSLEELLRRDPKDGATLHNLGAVYLHKNRPDLAVDAFRRSLQCRPDSAATRSYLECALKDLDQFSQLRKDG